MPEQDELDRRLQVIRLATGAALAALLLLAGLLLSGAHAADVASPVILRNILKEDSDERCRPTTIRMASRMHGCISRVRLGA
jgi:Na+/proline symporter